ncbi:MAG: RES family NAD+ phosphorylase [Myxococcota bacterium]
MDDVLDAPEVAVPWDAAVRIVKSVWPPIALFERIAEPSSWEALAALEGLTNPRLRQQIGEISLVPVERRVGGPGSTVVMAPFCHPPPEGFGGTRFGAPGVGCYYAGESLETAVAETAFHLGGVYADSAEERGLHADMRVYSGGVLRDLHDLRAGHADLHDPDSYAAAQRAGRALREAGSDGVLFRSVRRPGGECLAAFWPDVVEIPAERRHLTYHWDGARIDRYFDHRERAWCPVQAPAERPR